MDLSSGERDRFLEALIRLKHRPAPNGPAGVSVYDQFVALHGAVFAVLAPGLPPGETVNFGHWNIGFCAWHRKYVREFEKALQTEVAGVTLPYWDWSDHVGAVGTLFVAEFLGALQVGAPTPLTGGVLRNPVPPAERPPGGRRAPRGSRSTPSWRRVRARAGARQCRGRLAPDRGRRPAA